VVSRSAAACAGGLGQSPLPQNFPASFVNWLTLDQANPGQSVDYRKARADFNFRGWQGR
jgi:hypothetical protein